MAPAASISTGSGTIRIAPWHTHTQNPEYGVNEQPALSYPNQFRETLHQ